ncbi:MAG TPA: glycoside hydrolase family 3 N-terminal domain-containing protein [Streptosporangiaceae bacterium]|jgi:beta-N-acetylhexosaminidase
MKHLPARLRLTLLTAAALSSAVTLAAATASAAQAARGRPAAAAAPSLIPLQLAGQRVIYSYTGLTPPASLISQISHGEAAGVIFFGDNISSEAQIASVIKTLEAADAAATNPVHAPLLLMTDQEGGEVRRLPGPPFLSEKQIGASANPAAAASTAGTRGGNNLRGVGMNVNLAPVLDVYRQAGDFDDQFQRSYSMNPNVVSTAGAAFITAQQNTGVAATAKHFPGLGAATASQNTDAEPVTLNVSLSALRATDEFPYQAAIGAGVKLVMVSWAVYPALGTKRPAGLSSNVVGGELRTRLGFTGVTITDALEAGALSAYGSTQNRATLAAGAGMDLILCASGSVSQGITAMDGMRTAYNNGTLPHAAFQAAVNRVIALRQGLPA